MKARLTKLFTLLTILTLGITNVWAGVTIFSSVSQETTDGSWVITGSSNSASNQSNVVFPDPAAETGFPAGKVSASTAYYCKLSSSGDKGSKLSTTKRITIGGLSASDSIVVYWFATSTTTGKLCLSYATGASAGAYIEEVSLGTIVTKQLYATSFKALTATDIDHIENGYSGSAKLAYISSNGPSPYVYAVKIIAGSTTKHSVTYVLGDGTGTTPTQADVAEGAKFTLHDGVTGITPPASTKVFAGWNDGSSTYAGGAEYTMGTSDVTLTAQWSDKYTVTYDKNGGTGTMADTYNEIVACTFTAPDGKAFKEWNTQADGNGTTYAVGASVTSDLDLFAIWVKAPQVIFDWTAANSSNIETDDTDLSNSTYGTLTIGTSVAGRMFGTNTIAKNGAGYKLANNDVCIEIQGTSAFEAGDTVIITGKNGGSGDRCFAVAPSTTTDAVADTIMTNTIGSQTDNSIYKVVIKAAQEGTKLRVFRKAGSTMYCKAIKVIRPVKYDVNFDKNDADASGSMAAVQYPAGAEVTLPACTFTAPTDKEFDAWVSDDVTITAGKFTMPANDVTIKATWKAEATKYDITYYPGANGSGSIAAGKKTEDVDFVLSSERFTRAGYLQTGWATEDGGAQAYALGATYTANEALDLYPVWTELTTYVAEFACGDAAPAGWTFSNDGFDADNKATVASVCTFVDNGLGTPKQTTGDGTSDDDVAFAKNTGAIATYDLGITTTVAALDVVLTGGSSSAFNEEIELLGADGTTVKQSYTTSLSAGNWKDNAINKTDIVEDVRYIRVHGATKWVVMKDFSVQYIETRPQYNVEFAAGTYGTGTMATRKYIEDATVTVPDCGFVTSDASKEFDKWSVSGLAGVTELAAGETFAMPTNTVTLTALWRVATTKYTVTYYDGATELGSEEVAEGSNPAEYATYQDKANHVFLGWFNDADLTPAHAVADISAEVIDAAANYYGKWALDLQVTKIVFSNGFDAFINKDAKTVKAYYMSGESAPTMTSYEANANVKADGVTIVGNKVVLTGTDDSEIEYDLTIEAVTPLTTLNALQTFDGSEAYVKAGLAYDGGWKFRKNADDGRIPKGYTRIYFFVGGGAEKATFTSCATKRNVKIYVNNVETSVTETAASGSTFDVPLDPADANNMIAIVSNQTSGDGGVGALELVASAPTPETVRTGLEVGRYYTICLPKKVVAATGATFWSMSERNTDTENPLAYIVEENLPLTAGQPFLFQATATTLEVTYEGEATTAGSHGALHGTLDAMDQAALDAAAGANTLYILKNNELRLASGRTGNSLAANRAYIIYEELDPVSTPSHAPGRQVRSMPLHKDVATGLDDLNADTQAQKVLLNGQLFIIRGEKMYDATGILVK